MVSRTKTIAKRPRSLTPPPAKRTKKAKRPKLSASRPNTNATSRRQRQQAAINSLPAPPEHPRPAFTLFVWGTGDTGQLGLGPIAAYEKDQWDKPKRNTLIESMAREGAFGDEGSGLVAIAAGGMHSLVVGENGTVYSFGVNDDGALGRETTIVPDPPKPREFEDTEASPHPVQALVDEGFHAIKVIAGDSISAALDSGGRLRVWGSFKDTQGVMGSATQSAPQFVPIPTTVSPPSLRSPEQFVSIAAGDNHLLALTVIGKVYAFGNGEYGQLGLSRRKINVTVPDKEVILGKHSTKAVVIGAGGNQSFAVDEEGVVWGWGLNSMGQLGVGRDVSPSSKAAFVFTPLRVVGLSKEELGGATIIEISAGESFTLFLASDGKVFTCGSSINGRLGLAKTDKAFSSGNTERSLPKPVLITFPYPVCSSNPIIHLASGSRNSLAITASGVMLTWGQHNQGGLGLGEEYEVSTPTVVVRQDGSWRAKTIACGGPHCLALLERKM